MRNVPCTHDNGAGSTNTGLRSRPSVSLLPTVASEAKKVGLQFGPHLCWKRSGARTDMTLLVAGECEDYCDAGKLANAFTTQIAAEGEAEATGIRPPSYTDRILVHSLDDKKDHLQRVNREERDRTCSILVCSFCVALFCRSATSFVTQSRAAITDQYQQFMYCVSMPLSMVPHQ